MQTSATNEKGFYRFISLPPGAYTVTFSLSGFATVNRQGVKAGVGQVDRRERDPRRWARGGGHGHRRGPRGGHPDQPGQHQLRQGLGPQRARAALQHVRPARRRAGRLPELPGRPRPCRPSGPGSDENSFQIDGTNLTASSTGEAWPYPNTDAIEEIEVLSLGRAGRVRQRHRRGLQRRDPPGIERSSTATPTSTSRRTA